MLENWDVDDSGDIIATHLLSSFEAAAAPGGGIAIRLGYRAHPAEDQAAPRYLQLKVAPRTATEMALALLDQVRSAGKDRPG